MYSLQPPTLQWPSPSLLPVPPITFSIDFLSTPREAEMQLNNDYDYFFVRLFYGCLNQARDDLRIPPG